MNQLQKYVLVPKVRHSHKSGNPDAVPEGFNRGTMQKGTGFPIKDIGNVNMKKSTSEGVSFILTPK